MEDNKFKSVLQERVNKDKENAKKDAELRKQFGIEDGRTVGIKVHKENIMGTIWRILSDIIQTILKIVLLCFAMIGVLSILHPDIREILLISLKDCMEQIKVFAPFLPIM